MEKQNKNEHPFWVDVAKQFLDEQGKETIEKILDLVLPESAKKWIVENPSTRKTLGAALSGLSIWASRAIPDTPWGVIAEEAVRELVATLKDYFADLPVSEIEKAAQNLPSKVKEKIKVAEAAVNLGRGDLPLEDAKSLSEFIISLQKEKGAEASQKAILMLDAMSFKNLSAFAKLSPDGQRAEFKARSWKPEAPPKEEKEEGPGWIEKQRAGLNDLNDKIKTETERLAAKKAERKAKLRHAWSGLVNPEVEVTDDWIVEETDLPEAAAEVTDDQIIEETNLL
ncbi:MAG: hypothetical protein V1661_01685 [bacterium]